MSNRIGIRLSFGKKIALAVVGVATLTAPMVVGILNPLIVSGQSPEASHLKFEVVSIKQHRPGDQDVGFPRFLPGGRMQAHGVPVWFLITTAYNLPFQSPQLSGGPDWLRSESSIYDIDAKAPDGAIPPALSSRERSDKMCAMLQALLADRFHLKLRRETKELPVYALILGKSSPKLQKSNIQEKDCDSVPVSGDVPACHDVGGGQGRGIQGRAVDLSDVARFVSNWTDRPVIDRTGLHDLYEIKTEGWVPIRARPPRADGQPDPEGEALHDLTRPTLFVIFERLGLKLESTKGPVEMFVIDHVERPSPN